MTVFPLLAASLIMNVIAAFFIISAVALILIILVQKGKGGGLGAALGGGLASGILGSKTGDFLTWLTIGLVSVFLLLAVVMAKFYKPAITAFGEGQTQEGQTQQAPVQQQMPADLPPIEETEQSIPFDDTVTDSNAVETNLPGEK